MGWDTEIVKGFINICLTDFGRAGKLNANPLRTALALAANL
jgi:hypothetical protein